MESIIYELVELKFNSKFYGAGFAAEINPFLDRPPYCDIQNTNMFSPGESYLSTIFNFRPHVTKLEITLITSNPWSARGTGAVR